MSMSKKDDALTVLLVEDDTSVCSEFVSYIDDLDDTRLIGVTNSSYKALELIRDNLPEALILDLELHNGSGNGLYLLNDLRSLDPALKPYTIITTNNSSTMTFESVRQLGADFIFTKHQSGYSPRSAVDFLRIMRSTIKDHRKTSNPITMESHAVFLKRINRRICAELDLLGMKNSVLGYQYLVDAIELYIEKPSSNLCLILGKRYEKTGSSIERAMKNAIEHTWNTIPYDTLTNIYTAHIDPKRGVPTILEFVSHYAKKIKCDL